MSIFDVNYEEMIFRLQDPDLREEFIMKLKNAGKNSNSALHVQNAMTELKVKKTPRGIFQKTIVQHTLRFCDTIECFKNLRLVCKVWQDAVETIRFNRKLRIGCIPSEKYSALFRKLEIPMHSKNRSQIHSLLLSSSKKLNEIIFDVLGHDGENLGQESDFFMSQMLQNSHSTLQFVDLPKFVIPQIDFPNLTKLEFNIGNMIGLAEFRIGFPKALAQMKNLEIVRVYAFDMYMYPIPLSDLVQRIHEKYEKHCISAEIYFEEKTGYYKLPVKILELVSSLDELQNHNSLEKLQFLHIVVDFPESVDWNQYCETLDQCSNLKSVELTSDCYENDFVREFLPTLPAESKQMWNERVAYLKARGIRIANKNEIFKNQDLRNKLAKEAGVQWRFHLY